MSQSPVSRRAALSLTSVLLASACAQSVLTVSAPDRFAATLAALDDATGELLGRLGQAQGAEDVEVAALRYAAGRQPPAAGPLPAAVAAHAMEPVLVALAVHARRLAAFDDPTPAEGPPPPDAAMLRREAEQGLAALRTATRRPLPEPARRGGLAAIGALIAPPAAGTSLADYVTSRQSAVEAAAGYLQAVIGEPGEGGLRGALEARHRATLQAEEALLRAAQGDRGLSVMERYRLFHRINGMQSAVPGEMRRLDALDAAFDAIPEAHAALARGEGEGAPAFAAFVTAVAAVQALAADRPAAR